jgi:hypothetical protein
MKKIFTLLLLALMVQISFAQEEEKVEKVKNESEEMNTIFTKDNLKVTGGYITPVLKIGNVHEDASLLVGGIYVYDDVDDFFNNTWDEIENSAALVIEPGVNVEFNLFKFFRVDLGASYRLVSETDLQYLSDEDLSDFTVNVGFKFGFF